MKRIFRSDKDDSQYTRIDNRTLQNADLTWEERGLLAYLLSKPDDWEVMMGDIQAQSPAGRDKTQGIIQGLIDKGYIVRERAHIDGRFKWTTKVFEIPSKAQSPDFQSTEKQLTEKPLIVESSIEEQSTDEPSIYKQINLQTNELQTNENTNSNVSRASRSTSNEPKKRTGQVADEEYIAKLQKNPAYSHIDFFIEYNKASAWCDINNRKLSRRFFLNWINRVDRPVNINSGENSNGQNTGHQRFQSTAERNTTRLAGSAGYLESLCCGSGQDDIEDAPRLLCAATGD